MLEKCPKIGVRSYQRDNLYESFEIYKKEVHSSPGNAMFPGFFFA